MLRATGIDIGNSGTRQVSVGQYWGAPSIESSTPSGGTVIANVSAERLTFRRITVPHVGRDIQAQVVREELAYSLPFSLELATWDWIETEEIASVVIAFNEDIVALRKKIGERVMLDAEPFSILRALLETGKDEALIFDFGATHTTICAIKDKNIEWMKVSLRGGKELTNRLSKAHNFGEQEAEEHKRAIGCEDPICSNWANETLINAGLSAPTLYDNIYICGGGAAMPGLLKLMEDKLGQKVELFPLPKGLNAYEHVMAFGAALAGKSRRPKVQLCPAVPKTSDIKIMYAIWVAIILMLGTIDIELRHANISRIKSQHIAVIREALQAQAPDMFDLDIDKIVPEINKRLEEAQRISLGSPTNYLMTLANLAKPMANMSSLEVRSIEFKPDNSGKNTLVTLSGLAETAQQVEDFRSACDKVLTKAELIDNRAGASNTTRYTIEGQLRQQ